MYLLLNEAFSDGTILKRQAKGIVLLRADATSPKFEVRYSPKFEV
jgi:hypothetical protein